jgi:hypothetical protein
VRGGERFLLVQAPDVEFVDSEDAWDLEGGLEGSLRGEKGNGRSIQSPDHV